MAAALLVAYGILAVLYSVTTPAYEAPDEVAHLTYAQSLLERRALPVQKLGELSASHHPPAYYLLAAVAALVVDPTDTTGAFRLNPRFVYAGQGGNAINAGLHGTSESFPYQGQAAALHLARGVSIVLGGVTVMLTIAIGWLVFPDRRGVGLLAGALVALNPQFLFISGAVNNDNLLIAVSAATWWQLIRTFRAPDRLRGWFMVALLLSVGVLAKSSGLVNVAVVLAALLAMAIKRRSMSLVVKGGAVILATLAVLTGWWFIRNQQLYGDLMGWGVYTEVFAVNMRLTPLWPELGRLFETQFRSYWAVFGWMLVTPPEWFYGVVLAVMLVALAGVIVLFVSRAWSRLSGFQKGMLVLLAGAIVAHEAYLGAANTRFNPSFFQGRYLFPVIAPVAIWISLGLMTLAPKRLAPSLAYGIGAALFACAVYMLVQVIGTAYRTDVVPKWQLQSIPNRTDYVLGDMVALEGSEVRAGPGTRVHLHLFWRAKQTPDFDYLSLVHVVNASGQEIAQQDRSPGSEYSYPPSVWVAGDVVGDEYSFDIPLHQRAGGVRFLIGLYNWATGERLKVAERGATTGDVIVLGPVMLPQAEQPWTE